MCSLVTEHSARTSTPMMIIIIMNIKSIQQQQQQQRESYYFKSIPKIKPRSAVLYRSERDSVAVATTTTTSTTKTPIVEKFETIFK